MAFTSPRRPRTARSRLAVAVPTTLLALGLLASTSALADHDSETIHGCHDNKSGDLRVVLRASQCDPKHESAIEWSEEGPAGPRDPLELRDPKAPPGRLVPTEP